MRQERFPLGESEDRLAERDVEDAFAATAAERMQALVSLLDAAYVYVVIGGMGVLALIPYRTTRDIDVLIEPTLENAHKARRAVARWGRFEPEYAAEEFLSGDVLSFGGLLRVEVHSAVPDVK